MIKLLRAIVWCWDVLHVTVRLVWIQIHENKLDRERRNAADWAEREEKARIRWANAEQQARKDEQEMGW